MGRVSGERWQWLLCVAAAITLAGLGGCRAGRDLETRPNILLVTVDTLRADHLGSYGYGRRTDPSLARLAATGVRFEHALAQAPWTLPSVASIHTALYPSQHGAVGAQTRLSDEVETLAEVLQAEGYQTLGVVSHKFVDARHGLAQGFERFDETNILGHDGVTSEALTETALAMLEEASQPFFLWVHYFDPHFTYVRHPEFGFADGYDGRLPEAISARRLGRERRAAADRDRRMEDADLRYVRDVYDEEVAHTAGWIGALHEGLDGLHLQDRTVWIVTADHGEYFLERGRFFHGKDVYEPLVHVPLIIGGAIDSGLRGVSVDTPVETRSIPTTVMSLLDIRDHPFAGEDALAVARGDATAPVFTEGSYAFGTDRRKQAVLHQGWKLIRNLDDERYELYHLPSDSEERDNRWGVEGEAPESVAAELQSLLVQFADMPGVESSTIQITPDGRKKLEALGYLRGGS